MITLSQQDWISRLNPNHLQDLRASGLSDETIYNAKLRSASTEETAKILNFDNHSISLVFSYIDLKTGVLGEYSRVKVDEPPIIESKPAKYLSPQGSGNRLYIPLSVLLSLKDYSVPLYITEGEKKALKAVQEGLVCIGLSGVWGWKTRKIDEKGNEVSKSVDDLDLIYWKKRSVFIIFDSDVRRNSQVRKAEVALAKELERRGAKVKILRLPSGENGEKVGLDDFLLKHPASALQSLPISDSILWERIDSIRESKLKPFQKKREVADLIIKYLSRKGKLICSQQEELFFFESQKHKLFSIREEEQFNQFLLQLTGLNPTETEFNYVLKEIETEATIHGCRAEVFTLSFYDASNNQLYINSFDNRMYLLNGKKIQLLPNGTDGILFRSEIKHLPFQYLPQEKPDGLIDELILNRLNIEDSHKIKDEEKQSFLEQNRLLLLIYIFTLFFGNLLPTRVILAFVGEKGSGKTLLLKLIGRLIFGPNFNVVTLIKEKEDAFTAAICRYPFVAYDNVDENIPWLNDALARIATGQTIPLRKLYETNTVVEYTPNTFLALSSRTPKFKRDDVVERLLLFRLKRLKSFESEKKILSQLDQHRDLLWTELLISLNEIVSQFPSISTEQITDHRMADFANLGFQIANCFDQGETFKQVLDDLSQDKAEFLLEEDPLLHALSVWLNNGYNFEKQLSASELHAVLKPVFKGLGYEEEYRNPAALARRLKKVGDELSSFLKVELKTIPHAHNNQNLYIFKNKKVSQ